MASTAHNGKSYAGNPRMWIDGENGASSKLKCSSPLYNVRSLLKGILLAGVLAGGAGVGAGEIVSITFTGDQYVDTTVYVATNLVVACDFQLLNENVAAGSANPGVFGMLDKSNDGLNVGWGLRAHGQTGDERSGNWVAWTGSKWVVLTENPIDTNRHTIELRNGQVKFDGTVYASEPSLDPSTGLSPRTFKIGDDGWAGGPYEDPQNRSRTRFFSLKFWTDDGGTRTLIADYVPWEQDGFYGVYDKVSQTFCKQVGGENILNGVWTRRPSIAPTAWNRRAGVVPTVDCGEGQDGGMPVCSHTAEQLAALPVGRHPVTFTFQGNTITIPVTVTDPLTCAYAGSDARTVDLTFASAAETRTLTFAYGPSDAGDDLAAWTQTVEVEVPAGVDHLDNLALPDEIGDLNPVWRVFLPEPRGTWTASSYVHPDSLIAQFDGIENAGYGVHDTTLWVPSEIRRGLQVVGYGVMPVEDQAFVIGKNSYFKFNSPVLQNAINEGHATVELVLSDGDGAYMHNGGIFCAGDASRGFWVYQKNDDGWAGIVGDLSYHAQPTGEYNAFDIGGDGVNTWSYLLGKKTESSSCLRNGTRMWRNDRQGNISRFETDMTDDVAYVGILPGSYLKNNYLGQARVHSIRVYNRVLTVDEVLANTAVDVHRFTGTVYERSDVFFEPVPLTVKKVNRTGGLPVSLSVAFTGESQVRELWLVWGDSDAGEDMDAWCYRTKMCEVPAGTSMLAEAPVPEAAQQFLSTHGGFRLVLRDKSATASDYARMDQMLLQWDGQENAGYGTHDPSLAMPVELRTSLAVSASGPLPHDNRSFWLGENYFSFTSDELRDAVNAGNATVEMVVAENGGYVNNGGIFALGNQARGLWFYQKDDQRGGKVIADVSYHAAMSGEYDMFNLNEGTATNTYAYVCGSTSQSSFFAFNGSRVNIWATHDDQRNLPYLNRFTTDSDSLCYIGILPGAWLASSFKGVAKVYSIRVYGCVLSAAEIAANAAVDRLRFGPGSRTYEMGEFTRGSAAGISIFVR